MTAEIIKTSIVIPSRNEKFLVKTVNDLLSKNKNIEIIVVLEGYWEHELPNDPRVIQIHHGQPLGMRKSINDAVAIARGEYILKIDGHCMVAENMCETLAADCADNEVIIPRRKRLDAVNWCLKDTHKIDIDYEYVCAPIDPKDFGGKGLNGKVWNERSIERKDILIDENLSFQGSCWFMKKSYFHFLELMDQESYGPFWNEAQEIGLKCWLSGGRVLTNKKTWYAHLHKGKEHGRGYNLPESWLRKGSAHTRKWMTMGAAWHKQTLPIEWLLERFAPVPSWAEYYRLLEEEKK